MQVYLYLCQSYQKVLYIFFPHIYLSAVHDISLISKIVIQFIKTSMILSLSERQFSYKHYFRNTVLHINIKVEINQNQIFSENKSNVLDYNFLTVEP